MNQAELTRLSTIACVWEATARKAGNVHRFADFDNLTYVDFVMSAVAVGPVLGSAGERALGQTILRSIQATREVVSTNTNLGIVLLLAPLARAAWNVRGLTIRDRGQLQRELSDVLRTMTVDDSCAIFEAIRTAMPGGLGKVDSQDVSQSPDQPFQTIMALAADRDMIARQYTNDFLDIMNVCIQSLLRGWQQSGTIEGAILTCQLESLACFPDSLIARKRGATEAGTAQEKAQGILNLGGLAALAGQDAFRDLDRWMREDGHARNPGTTADLVTACLFIALWERTLTTDSPFHCPWL